MTIQFGQYAIFPTEKFWNAAVDLAIEKGVPVYGPTKELRRWERFPGLKMGHSGLAGFRPEGKPEEESFEELSIDEFLEGLDGHCVEKIFGGMKVGFDPRVPSMYIVSDGTTVLCRESAEELSAFIDQLVSKFDD